MSNKQPVEILVFEYILKTRYRSGNGNPSFAGLVTCQKAAVLIQQ